MKMCKRLYTPKISSHVILHVVKQGPVLVHIKKYDVVCETHLFGCTNILRCFCETDVRTS